MGRFVRAWARLVFLGDGLLDFTVRWLAYILAGGTSQLLPQDVAIAVASPFGVVLSHYPLGTWLLIGLAIIWGLVTFGASFVLSLGPRIKMATELEEDTQNQFYRLRLQNIGGGVVEPAVLLTDTADEKGQPLIERALLPIELHWSHHQDKRVKLVKGDTGATLGVLWIKTSRLNAGVGMPLTATLTGMEYKQDVDKAQLGLKRKHLYLEITAAMHEQPYQVMKRWFGVVPDQNPPMYYRVATQSELARLPSTRRLPALNRVRSTLRRLGA